MIDVDPGPLHCSSQTAGPECLSPRELAIIRLIASGYTNIEIGQELYLSVNTVKTYIRAAYRRIGVTRRTQAVIWAITHGLP